MTASQVRRITSTRKRFALGATVVGTAMCGALLGVGPAQASSHREAPLTAGDPKIDNTDVYAFVSPDDTNTVTLLANWIPFEEPNGGPNFYPFQDGAHYDIKIDNDGDGKADIVYRWVFTAHDKRGTNTFLYNNGPVTSLDDPNLLYKQTYTLSRLAVTRTKHHTTVKSKVIATGTAAPSDVGPASMPDYASLRAASITPTNNGGKTFAGQSDDSFFLDLRVFDLLYGGNLSEVGQDTLKGYNVNSVGLQVPKSDLTLHHNATDNPVIGIWSSTSKRPMKLDDGKPVAKTDFQQVSRLGQPLVNELVIPAGLKDAFNAIPPSKDADIPQVVKSVTNPELPGLIQGIYGIPAPATPRNDLVEIFLTGIAKHAPTLDGSAPPIQADLNSQVLNKDVDPSTFRPSEMLRLNTAIAPTATPNRLGVIGGDLQGFPNGRRLTDDVVDIELQAFEGASSPSTIVAPLATGDKVNANDQPFGTSFPYLALPNTAAVNTAGGSTTTSRVSGTGWFSGKRVPPAAQGGALAAAGALMVGFAVTARRRRRGQRGLV